MHNNVRWVRRFRRGVIVEESLRLIACIPAGGDVSSDGAGTFAAGAGSPKREAVRLERPEKDCMSNSGDTNNGLGLLGRVDRRRAGETGGAASESCRRRGLRCSRSGAIIRPAPVHRGVR